MKIGLDDVSHLNSEPLFVSEKSIQNMVISYGPQCIAYYTQFSCNAEMELKELTSTGGWVGGRMSGWVSGAELGID